MTYNEGWAICDLNYIRYAYLLQKGFRLTSQRTLLSLQVLKDLLIFPNCFTFSDIPFPSPQFVPHAQKINSPCTISISFFTWSSSSSSIFSLRALAYGYWGSPFWNWYSALSLTSQTSTLQTDVSAEEGYFPSLFSTVCYCFITSDRR